MPVQDLGVMTERPTFWLRSEAKLGTFEIASSISDLIVMAIWNRIRIMDLAVSA
jgi:hypothetical protein